ncbi:MAG: PAS domain-containing protein, partial [Thermodesulfobacteriota bacterium]
LGNQAAVAIQNAMLYNEILEIKDYNENILEQMANGIITVDRGMCVTTFNKKAADITGISKEEALGRQAHFVHTEIAQLLSETLHERQTFSNVELIVPKEDGTHTPISVSTSSLREPTGRTSGALAVFTDLTDIKVLEGEVRRAE